METEGVDRARGESAEAHSAFVDMAEDCRRENSRAGSRGGGSAAGEKRSAPETPALQIGDWFCTKDRCYNHMYADRTYCGRHWSVQPGQSDHAVKVTAENKEWLTKCVAERKEEIARKRSK